MAKYLLRRHAAHGRAARRPGRAPSRNPLVRFQHGSRSASSGARTAIATCWRSRSTHRGLRRRLPGLRRALVCWCRFSAATSSRRSTPARSAARARAGRHADRGDCGAFRHVEQAIRRSSRRTRSPPWSTTSALSFARSTRPTTTPAGSAAGRRHPDRAERGSRADRPLRRVLREQLPRQFPGVTSPSCPPTSSARS